MSVKFTNSPDVKFTKIRDPHFTYRSKPITVKIDVRDSGVPVEYLRLKLIITGRSKNYYFDNKKSRILYITNVQLNENKIPLQYYSDLDDPTLYPHIVMRVSLIQLREDGSFDRVLSWDQEKYKTRK